MDPMEVNEQIKSLDAGSVKIIRYPDPVLRQVSAPLEGVSDELRTLVGRMFELMFAARGVGLAGAQVGAPGRIFIASPTFQDSDRRVYVNPRIVAVDGSQDGDEGCLSFPGIYSKVKRYNFATIEALNLQGELFQETGEELAARIFQHELDHLEGRLLVDRMSTVSRLSNRRALKDLEDQFAAQK